jgi:phosphate transporter
MALVIILLFCLTAATFVSHTVASLILMPVISTLGISIGMPEIAVMGSAFAGKCASPSIRFPDVLSFCLLCVSAVSAAMALPFSSFPNVNSVLIVDDFQRPYLTVGDFVKTGLPLSVICVFLISTFGYLLIKNIIV